MPHLRATGARRISSAIAGTLVGLLVAIGTLATAGEPPSVDAQTPLLKEIYLPNAGRLGPVTVLGDSVMLGSGLVSPTLPDQLVAAGWGPVRFRATVGMRAGAATDQNAATTWINSWRSFGWDAPTVIVNLGANDVGICGASVACARARILAVVDTIGPGKRIWWPLITHSRGDYSAAWNQALSQIDAERLDVVTWNWPAEMAGGGYPSPDAIHLSGDGYRRRSARMADEVTATVGRGTRIGGDAALARPTSGAVRFEPITPERVLDTRLQPPGRLVDGQEIQVPLAAYVPPGTTAVAVNVTAASPTADGYLSAGACGTAYGGASVANFTNGVARGAMAVVPVSADRRLCVFARGSTDIIVDIQGAFVPGGGSGLSPLANNDRPLDTRRTGRSRQLVVATPPGAAAVALNLTVADPVEGGWLRASPCGSPSAVSNVNFLPGETVAGSAFVATGPDDTVCIEVTTSADVIVDLTGTFGAGGLSYVPAAPTRMLDTRNAIGGWAPVQGPDQVLDVAVAPPNAEAVTGTLTLVQPATGGYLVGYGCGPLPPTSSVNAAAGQVLANSITTAISGGRFCVSSYAMTHTLFDTTGWWVR